MSSILRVPLLSTDAIPRICKKLHCFQVALKEHLYCIDHKPPERKNPKPHNKFVVYFISYGTNGPVKIGKAFSLENRLKDFQICCPYKLCILAFVKCEDNHGTRKLEHSLHIRLAEWRLNGEWFKRVPDVKKVIKHAKIMDGDMFYTMYNSC